ncbi:hypothetical protein PhaeoP30_00468 [Phaeobacter inhibens]|nr:hypothetical protein PhaeoP30_00468 [Phaeobacter inhibens]
MHAAYSAGALALIQIAGDFMQSIIVLAYGRMVLDRVPYNAEHLFITLFTCSCDFREMRRLHCAASECSAC